jgi:transposase
MRPSLKIQVRGRQRSRLQRMYNQTTCPRTRIRVQMVLLAHDGHTSTEIAAITQQSDDSVRRWLHRFMQHGCDGLSEREHSGRPPKVTLRVEAFLLTCLLHAPRDFGFERASWTTTLLAQAVERRYKLTVSPECIRQHLAQRAWVCRRPTWTVKHLAQAQRGYAQKKARLPGFYGIRRLERMSTSKMKPS